jgi:glyoxylase-like metal-dependent hydrolase (beta-lactamase superfamily II)
MKATTAVQQAAIAERLILLDHDQTPVSGITAVSTAGHTPGHISFVVSSGAQRAVILGDMIHCPIEIGEREIDFVFDVDPVLARLTKRRIRQELERPDTVTVGGHFPNLVFGRVLPGSVPVSVDFSISTVLK